MIKPIVMKNKMQNISFKQARVIIFLLGLFFINGQAVAQQPQFVDIFRNDFGTGDDDFLTTNPGYTFNDFIYATDGSVDHGECIITKNAKENGFWGDAYDRSGSGYYAYGNIKSATDMKFYSVDTNVTAGQPVRFNVYIRSVGNTFQLALSAEGDESGIIATSADIISHEESWVLYSLAITASATETVTFSIIARAKGAGENDYYMFGIDDVTISTKAIEITSPSSLAVGATINNDLALEAKYSNPLQSGNPTYRWERSETGATGSWVVASDTKTGNPTFITQPFSVQETTEKYVYYRLAVSYDNFGEATYYSDIIIVDFRSDKIIFKEDFGGNSVSTASTNPSDPSGASGDWWIMPGEQPSITTDFVYGEVYDWDKLENAYGQKPVGVSNDGTYVITKLSGVKNGQIPGYPDADEGWSYGGECCYDDQSLPGDSARGYFMNILTEAKVYKTVYAAPIQVKEEMIGQNFTLSVWQVAMWGINDDYPLPLRLVVEDNTGAVIKSQDYSIRNTWGKSNLTFGIPVNYTPGNNITIRVMAIGRDLRLGLDNISVAWVDQYVTITSPEGGLVCHEQPNVQLIAQYAVGMANAYKWQFNSISSDNSDSNWTDISGASGSLADFSGNTPSYSLSVSSPANTGYYRVLITKDNFATSVSSDAMGIAYFDPDEIKYTQSGYHPDENITITVDYQGKIFSSPPIVYEWYNTAPEWNKEGEGNTFELSNPGSGIPASGEVNNSIYYARLHYAADNNCAINNPAQFTIINNRWSEDFKTGTSNRIAKADAGKTYTIPGFSYVADYEGTIYANCYAFTKNTIPRQDDYDNITDSNDGGYFLQVSAGAHDADDSPVEFYKTTLDNVCAGGKYSFTAMIANLIPQSYHKMQFCFRVRFEEIGNEEIEYEEQYFITSGNIISTSGWIKNGFDFLAPEGSVRGAMFRAVCSIESTGYLWSQTTKDFGLDDVKIERLSPAQIIAPSSLNIQVFKGTKVDIQGIYACGSGYDPNAADSPNSIIWQVSTNGGGWSDIDATSGATEITTTEIEIPSSYRIKAEASKPGNSELYFYSEALNITPMGASDLGKTYYVCPDNMSEDEAKNTRKMSDNKYLPAMISKEEPGYLPSLIHMEVTELHGITYKWYDVKSEGTPLNDADEYDPTQLYENEEDIADPILLPDGKSNTLSVMNERSETGIFTSKTYWVEICDSNGNPLSSERIEIKLAQAYLCGSTEDEVLSHPVVSPNNARRIHRENFGGTSDSDLPVSQDPLEGIDYWQYKQDDPHVPEGSYKVVKDSPTLGNNNWTSIKDHIYEDVPNENSHGYLVAVNASGDPGLFYTYRLENLGACDGLNLLFTGWFTSPVHWYGTEKANLMFKVINTDTGEILSEFTTGNMLDGKVGWRQFGFMFEKQPGVDNLTLEIINNNFGTAGGNDVLMDDMEIYLSIPPVQMTPAENSFVCQEGNNIPHGIGELFGEYEDNGTLGNNLEYWWEYKKEGTENWVPAGALDNEGNMYPEGYGTVTDGKVYSIWTINEFTAQNNGDYRLVIGKPGSHANPNYDCTAVSEPRKLTYAGNILTLPTPAFDNAGSKMNVTAYCYAGNEYISVTNFDDDSNIARVDSLYSDFYWMLDGNIIHSAEDATNKADSIALASELKLTLADLPPGHHTISLRVINKLKCESTAEHHFIIFPETTTWTAEGEAGNWNDAQNWSNGVPGDCSQVIIPNKSHDVANGLELLSHYPVLIEPTVETLNSDNYTENQENVIKQRAAENSTEFSLRPVCNTITFNMGGAVAHTEYLNYTFAKVDLDVLPNRWYTLSAPLRDMYSGDYFEEKSRKRLSPSTYMRKFNATNPETKEHLGAGWSKSFNTLTEDLYTGLGFTIWAANDNEGELQSYRFPKDSMVYCMYTSYGAVQSRVYIPAGGRDDIGRFTYEGLIAMDGSLPDKNVTGFEVTVKEDENTFPTTLVGNPFMAHLDFRKFAAENPAISDEGYYIWNGTSFDAMNPGTFNDQSLIAPLQSFVVKKKDMGGGTYSKIENHSFTFDMAAATPSTGGILRSARTRGVNNPVLRMAVLRDGVEHSNVRLKYDPSASNAYSEEKDMWTMFTSSVKNSAVLYSLLDNKAASIRTIGDLSAPIELGIRTNKTGELTLRMDGLENFDAAYDVYLEDKLTDKIHNLKEEPDFTFNNATGNIEGRLFLIITEKHTITFNISNEWGLTVNDATITFDEIDVETDNYTTEYLQAGTYHYSISKEGYETTTGSITIHTQDETVDITLQAIPYSVVFNIEGEEGQTIDNAAIVFNGQTLDDYSVTPVYIGTYSYTVSKEGYETIRKDITITNQNETINITLQPLSYTVTFSIKDGDNNMVNDAEITFNGQLSYSYIIAPVFAGTYNYYVSKENYLTAAGEVTVIDHNKMVDIVLVSNKTTEVNRQAENNIAIYPNPFNDYITIRSDMDIKTVFIRSISGQLFETIQTKGNAKISTSALPDGIYFISLEDVNGNVSVFKMLKK